MAGKYTPLENYLRDLPASEKEVSLSFEQIERILNDKKHAQAVKRENQKQFDQTVIRERLLARKKTKLSKFFRLSPLVGIEIDSNRK
jgi:hypothetical protein